MIKHILISCALALGIASSASAATPTEAQYGGHCALGLTMGKTVQTDCAISWTEPTSHKMYCFSTEQAKTDWAKNTQVNIAKADAEFTKHNALNAAGKAIDAAKAQTQQAMDAAHAGAGAH